MDESLMGQAQNPEEQLNLFSLTGSKVEATPNFNLSAGPVMFNKGKNDFENNIKNIIRHLQSSTGFQFKSETDPFGESQTRIKSRQASATNADKHSPPAFPEGNDMTLSGDHSDNDSEHSDGSVTRKIKEIELEIKRTDLNKKQKRLLQNRKSALKCRLKKQGQTDKIKNEVEILNA